jgi:hypothetical protein
VGAIFDAANFAIADCLVPMISQPTVSKMRGQRYEFRIGMHEAIEACFAIHARVTPGAVDRFDRAYEAKSKSGDDSEPGDDSKAPNYRQH